MKKIVLIVASIAIALTSNAQKVALHSSSGIQHFEGVSAFQNAYTASVSGDTIYLPGGSFNMPATIDKRLTVYGAGHYPDSTQATVKTFINGNMTLAENADYFYLDGVDISGIINFAYNAAVDGVVITRCKFISSSIQGTRTTNPSNNLSFINNVITGSLDLSNGVNILVANNIIATGISGTQGNVISNNIFLTRLGNGYYENVRGDNNLISNNIFLLHGSYGMVYNSQGNQFYNNLLAFATPNYGTNPIKNSNYEDILPADVFVNQSGTTFDYTHDYHLQAPTTYVGTDATQVGIYGGTFPYKEGAVPPNPHIQEQTIAPTATNGQLNVHIKAAAQNN